MHMLLPILSSYCSDLLRYGEVLNNDETRQVFQLFFTLLHAPASYTAVALIASTAGLILLDTCEHSLRDKNCRQ